MLSRFLESVLQYLPYIAFIALAMGVLLIIFLVFLARRAVKRTLRQRTLTRVPGATEEKFDFRAWMLRFKTWSEHTFDRIATFCGRLPKDTFSDSFRHTMTLLQTHLGGRHPQYQLPWFLIVGPEGSGKSTLIQHLNLERPIGRPDYDVPEELAPLIWHFYEDAVLLELKGSHFLKTNSHGEAPDMWSYLSILLNRFRPKRPLDGLILTIPCEDLIGVSRLSPAQIQERAEEMHTRLWQLQRAVGMKIPVYVIITKSDMIAGFDDFVRMMPEGTQTEMFGWSNPHDAAAGYTSSLLEEAFHDLETRLQMLRAGIFSDISRTQNHDAFFMFPTTFLRTRENLAHYINTLFKESAYQESFLLRGIYFTGQVVQAGEMAPKMEAVR